MRTDPIVIGKNYILPGDDIGMKRPNNNVLVVGTIKSPPILVEIKIKIENFFGRISLFFLSLIFKKCKRLFFVIIYNHFIKQ